MKFYFKVLNQPKVAAGFTLTELLIAAAITSVVAAVGFFGIATITDADDRAEAETQSRMELNRALDFMAEEVRTARRVNTTASTTTTASAAVTASNTATTFSPSLGSTGTIVVYLEVPISSTIPSTCPSGGPNAGSPPPQPSNFDRVVYDIRTNTSTWMGPRVISRYGRAPDANGIINPCSNPVASQTLVDSVSDTGTAPTCTSPAIRSGTGGFYVCVDGRIVGVSLRGKVSGSSDPLEIKTKVFVRSAP